MGKFELNDKKIIKYTLFIAILVLIIIYLKYKQKYNRLSAA